MTFHLTGKMRGFIVVEYLRLHGILAFYDVDTRAITRVLRNHGVMKGRAHALSYQEMLNCLNKTCQQIRSYACNYKMAR